MTLAELLEKKGTLAHTIKTLAAKANDDSQEWRGEDEAEWTRVNADYDANEAAIAEDNSRKEKAARAQAVEEGQRDRRNIGREDRRGNDGASLECTDEHRALAFQAWLRHNNGLELTEAHDDACQRAGLRPTSGRLEIRLGGMYPNQPAWSTANGSRMMVENRNVAAMVEKRALSVGTANAGGYTVDSLFMTELEQTLLAFDGPRQVSRVLRTSTGAQMLWPTVNDTSNTGALLAEAGSIGSSTDPTFAQKALDAYKYSSKPILVSEELLEDSAFNLSQVIAQMLGERLGRILGAQHTTGTGSSQPNGIVTASAAGKTAASATAVTALEILDLIHSIDPAYRSAGSVGFMMNDGILLAIRKLVDGDNRPLWEPSIQVGVADRLFGYPISINQNMQATLATATKTILFGDFSKFVIRDSGAMRFYRLEELYRANDQVGFIAFMRSDSECIQTAAIKHLVQA